jgi:glucosamine 6-phosphate synthetase-like amidotransferase/phosphosugar isomerase protein
MCGIAGFNLNAKEEINARQLSANLLMQIVKRGRHATGMAWLGEDPIFKVAKAPVSAEKFLNRLDNMSVDTKNAILHTRFATKGSPLVNANNHPIIAGKIVGVHNGHLSNDDAVFEYLEVDRKGQVDSEAAFALLNASKHHPTDVLDSLSGNAALAWLDTRNRETLQLARLTGSPLAVGQTGKGSFVFASTLDMLIEAVWETGLKLSWADEIAEDTFLKVKNGVVIECLDIGESLKAIAS